MFILFPERKTDKLLVKIQEILISGLHKTSKTFKYVDISLLFNKIKKNMTSGLFLFGLP